MAGKLENRLAKIEQVLAKRTREKVLTNCNCRDPRKIVSATDDNLEAELNLTCPVHEVRRLGRILTFVIVDTKTGRPIPNPRRDPLVEEYKRRYARQLEQMDEDDSENL